MNIEALIKNIPHTEVIRNEPFKSGHIIVLMTYVEDDGYDLSSDFVPVGVVVTGEKFEFVHGYNDGLESVNERCEKKLN